MADPISQLVHKHLSTTFPGAVIDIRCRGRAVYRRSFGVRQVYPAHRPMTVDTVFDLASLTKPLSTALLVLMVFEAQGISVDSTVGQLMADVPAETGKRSVRALLAHTAGFPPSPRLEHVFTDPDSAHREAARRRVLSITPQQPEGAEVLYSCTGFIILGELLEVLTGKRLDQLFSELIARPLDLEHLGYRPVEGPWGMCNSSDNIACTEFCSWRQRWIRGEVHDETAWSLGGVSGNAGLFGTSSDLQRLLGSLLGNCGSAPDSLPQLLATDLVEEAVTLQTDGLKSRRGLGFELSSSDNSAGPSLSADAFGHTGFTGTSFWVDPVADLRVVALTNRVHLGRSETAEPLLEFRRSLNTLGVEMFRKR